MIRHTPPQPGLSEQFRKPYLATAGDALLISPAEQGVRSSVIRPAEQGVRSSVIRLAPLIHPRLDKHGFTTALIGFAREHGVAAYGGEGAGRRPAADTRGTGTLCRLALETALARTRLHGVADEGVPLDFARLDGAVSNARTRRALGWADDVVSGEREDIHARDVLRHGHALPRRASRAARLSSNCVAWPSRPPMNSPSSSWARTPSGPRPEISSTLRWRSTGWSTSSWWMRRL